jgi:hypothetical protein
MSPALFEHAVRREKIKDWLAETEDFMDILMRTMNTHEARRTEARIRNKRRIPLYRKIFFILCVLLYIADIALTKEPLFFTGILLLLLGFLLLHADNGP